MARIIKLLFGLGKSDPDFKPSPLKILLIGILLGFCFLSIVTSLIILTGVFL